MGKYKVLGNLYDRIFRNDLNANFNDIDADLQGQKKRVDDLIVANPQPSEVQDARGGFTVLRDRLDSTDTQLAGVVQKNPFRNIVDLDINKALINHPSNPLTIPTYVPENDEVVHPSVYYNPDGWNGWKFWMAFTPYTASNNQVENPSIVVSQDGLNWQVPQGLTNPLALPPANGFNSDTHLCMSTDEKTLFLIYRVFSDSTEKLVSRSSIDGINWNPSVTILETNSTVERNVSPSVIWDGKQYVMWTVDIVPSPRLLKKRTSPTLNGLFTNPVVCTFTLPSSLTTEDIWHLDVKKISDKYYILVNGGDKSNGGSGGALVLGKSNDGVSWQVLSQPLVVKGGTAFNERMYRSCFLPKQTETGFYFAVWYSSIGGTWKIGYTEIHFDKDLLENKRKMDIISAALKLNPYVACDTFDRIDNSTALGTATTGQTWTASSGVIGISKGQAYLPSATNSRSVIDIGVADANVSCEIPVIGAQAWIVFRFVDASNFFRFGVSNSNVVTFQKIEAGATTTLNTVSPTFYAGDLLSVEFKAGQIKLYYNGNLFETIASVFNQTATKVGIQTADTTTRFDNFLVKQI